MKRPKLQESVSFDRPSGTPDSFGGKSVAWTEAHACRAEFIYSRGSEAVDAARLQGRSIYKVKIRQCDAAQSVTTDFRMRDVRRGVEYQIREVDAVTDRMWVYIVVESGVAV
jgi:head-tail adaptor